MRRLSERRLAQIQAITGLAFATFLVLHLINTALATVGQGAYDGYLAAVRRYYQAPGLEVLLILVVPTIHIGAGVTRALRRRQKAKGQAQKPPPLRLRLHRYSAVMMTLAFYGHVAATRGPGLLFDQPADMAFVHYTLTHYGAFFYPYYALLAASGAYHLLHGVGAALAVLGVRLPNAWLRPAARPFWGLAAAAAVVLVVGVWGIGGAFYDVDTRRFEEIAALFARYLPE